MVSLVPNYNLLIVEYASNILVLANCGKDQKYVIRNAEEE